MTYKYLAVHSTHCGVLQIVSQCCRSVTKSREVVCASSIICNCMIQLVGCCHAITSLLQLSTTHCSAG